MKRYKLLKDLPTFKAGDKFYLDINNNLRLSESEIIAYSHITLEKFPNILTDWFEEIPEEYKRWRAEQTDCDVPTYFSATTYDEACVEEDVRSSYDDFCYDTGNYFKTEDEAIVYMEYLLARQVILDDAGGGKFRQDGSSWYGVYYKNTCSWGSWHTYTYHLGIIYFKDEESLKKSLEVHKEQWDIVRKYETGEM